jgi:hypothetical protein
MYFFDQFNRVSYVQYEDYVPWFNATIRYITAEAVLTFVISLPLLAITIIAFIENNFRVEYELCDENPNIASSQSIKT